MAPWVPLIWSMKSDTGSSLLARRLPAICNQHSARASRGNRDGSMTIPRPGDNGFRPSVTEALDPIGAPLPVLVDGDEELDEGAFGQLPADRRADLLEHAAALADHHALLAVALDDDLDPDAGPLPLS